MLPACRTEGEGFAIPTFDVVPSDVEGFMEELWEFQSAFHDCFARSEPRAHFFDYMVGQFSQLERKSIEPMALQVEGGTIRGLQRFISDVRWDEEQMRWNYHQLVADEMGDPDGVLMFDETGFVKKGKDSVGVARQYCGTLGKVENCQVGVFAGYASRHGYALVDKRLFLPEAWFTDAYAARRTKCHVPDGADLSEQTAVGGGDVAGASRRRGSCRSSMWWRIASMAIAPTFWTPWMRVSGSRRWWRFRRRRAAGSSAPGQRTRATRIREKCARSVWWWTPTTPRARWRPWRRSLPASRWYRRTVSEGTKGPIAYAFARQRVTLCKEGLPDRTVWLVIKRTLGAEPRILVLHQ